VRNETQSIIRSIREKKGMTLAQLAAKIGKTAPYLSDIERGNRRGSYETIAKIANALGIEVEQIWRAS
jgi:transcriptional regulator with XRE-family HTH domain